MNEKSDRTQTIAITGATGLLGRHLCDHFRSRGWAINALVRDITKYPFTEKGIKPYKCDLPDDIDIKAIESADVVIHSAYMTKFTNIEEAKRVNEEGTVRLYEAVQNAGDKKFVFVSSIAARSNAQSYYAQSKYRLETMMDQERDLIIRPGLILASDGGLFQRITKQVDRLPIIPLFGGGHQKLNTVHVEDLCKVFAWALESRICGVITVAEPEGIIMKELLRAVLKQLGQSKMLIPVPGMPFVLLLQLLEALKLKLPLSSENLRGLLNRDNMDFSMDEKLKQSGIIIRSAHDSIKDLLS